MHVIIPPWYVSACLQLVSFLLFGNVMPSLLVPSQPLPSLWEQLRVQEAAWLRLLRPLHLMKALQSQQPSSSST
jgi:hypothetical protein